MSDMRRCEAGHVYDPEFYHRCPSCGIPGLAIGAAPEGTAVYGSSGSAAPSPPKSGGATVALEGPTAPPDIARPPKPEPAPPQQAPPQQAPRETPAFRADADPNATRIVGPPSPPKPKQAPIPQAKQPPPEKPPAPPPQRSPAGAGATQLIEDPLMGGFADPRRKAREAKETAEKAAAENQAAEGQPAESQPTSAGEQGARAPQSESPTADVPPPEVERTDYHSAESPTADVSAPEPHGDPHAAEPSTEDISAAAPPPHAPPPSAHQPAESGTIAFWGDLPGSKPAPSAGPAAAARPVVGWLVAIAGPEKGRDYRLFPEGNPIGRAETNQVVIEDPALSQQEPHAILYYDPRSDEPTYYLQPGPRHMVYHNGKPIFAATTLEAHDVLEMGGSKLLFVPLCTDRFRWSAAQADGGDEA